MNTMSSTCRQARRVIAVAVLSTLSVTSFAQSTSPVPPAPESAASAPIAPIAPPMRGEARPGPDGRRPDPRADARPPRPPQPAASALSATPAAPYEAQVTGYLLSPDAQVAGLLLDGGRQVRVPPHMGAQLTELVKPGQRVRVTGAGAPGWTLTALSGGKTLTDAPPAAGAAPRARPAPPASAAQGQAALKSMKTSGTVRQVLTGPRGETNGVVLDSGTQIAIPPHAARTTGDLLTVGTRLDVEGYGRTSSYGTVVQATTLGKPGAAPVTIFAPSAATPPAPPAPPAAPTKSL